MEITHQQIISPVISNRQFRDVSWVSESWQKYYVLTDQFLRLPSIGRGLRVLSSVAVRTCGRIRDREFRQWNKRLVRSPHDPELVVAGSKAAQFEREPRGIGRAKAREKRR